MLKERYAAIVERVRAAAERSGRADGVTLIAVSKTKPLEAIQELYALGHRDFGENYAQELVEKASAMAALGCTDVRWHFIGHLQSNKARLLTPWVSSVHSVDSLRLGQELSSRWLAARRVGRLPVFVEVNVDEEASKAGVYPVEAASLCSSLVSLKELSVEGLMCIPSAGGAGSGGFQRLRELAATCRTAGKLSMGMTSDFEEAIRQGSTHVRVGTAIFGER